MISELLALLVSNNLRPLVLVFLPFTVTGMFILPNASLLLIEDSPTFNDEVSSEEIKLSGSNNLQCSNQECHGEDYYDIKAEIQSSPIHDKMNCTTCHEKVSPDKTDCEDDRNPVSCTKCHEVYLESFSAHSSFVQNAEEDSRMNHTNEACVGCHTHAPVKINWTHRASLDFEVTLYEDEDGKQFDVVNMGSSGTANSTVWEDRTNKSMDFSFNLAT